MLAGIETDMISVTIRIISKEKVVISFTRCVSHWSLNVIFCCDILDDYDTVYIAHCYPYTYTKLQLYLRDVESDPKRKHLLQRKTLCQTVAGNNCDYVIISDFNNGK